MLFFAASVSGAVFGESGGAGSEYTLRVQRGGESLEQKMVVAPQGEGVVVEFVDDKGETSVNRFGASLEPLATTYINAEGTPYMEILFDEGAGIIRSSGLVEEEYDYEENVYDGNGSMFYVFSRRLPREGQRFLFHVLQSKDERMVEMYLSFVGIEEIELDGKVIEARKYENGLESALLSYIWPYKYYYWYALQDNRFLMYRGPAGHDDEELIQVISVR